MSHVPPAPPMPTAASRHSNALGARTASCHHAQRTMIPHLLEVLRCAYRTQLLSNELFADWLCRDTTRLTVSTSELRALETDLAAVAQRLTEALYWSDRLDAPRVEKRGVEAYVTTDGFAIGFRCMLSG